jgi:tRNA-Thr(GGU) m(6)t(6)A37 methyltransferase TsaA
MDGRFEMIPIGKIRKTPDRVWMEIDPEYQDAMNGLELYSHIHVLYWFHENDTPDQRQILKVHPCKNPVNPLTGVFATHSPMRPNLIGLTLCHVISIDGLCIRLTDIDARDLTPIIDIKGYFPHEIREPLRYPQWEQGQK